MDKSITKLYNNRVYTILATPSAARLPWLTQKYPEVLRVQRERRKNLFGGRHNHCYTSPVYREKVAIINTKLAERCKDIVSWDSYPFWHADRWFGSDFNVAIDTAFKHYLTRSLKGGKPFLLMESTPSFMSWAPVCKSKKPGMNVLSSLQAVAHGSASIRYFQWRQYRVNCEKFHGAVVIHGNSTETQVYQDVTRVGSVLKKLKPVLGSTRPAEVGLIFDWENRWASEGALAPRNDDKKEYEQTCIRHYGNFMKQGITVDIINMDCDFSAYRLLVAPMLYMIRKGVGERIERFVKHRIGKLWSAYFKRKDCLKKRE